MIIDYEDFQELASQGRSKDKRGWRELFIKLTNDDALEFSIYDEQEKYNYRVLAAIVLLHRRYGSWEKLKAELAAKYPMAEMDNFLAGYSELEWCNDKNIQKIANRLSVNDLITIMLWYSRWRREQESVLIHNFRLSCSTMVCFRNRLVDCTVKAALATVNGLPLNVNAMSLDCLLAMLETLSEPEWAGKRFYYMDVPEPASMVENEAGDSLAQSLLVLEALDIHPEELTAGGETASLAVFPDYNGHYRRLKLEKKIAEWFDALVGKHLEKIGDTGEVALILDGSWTDNKIVQPLIDEYMAKGQIKCIFNIPGTEHTRDKTEGQRLVELRCVVFSRQSSNDKVKVVDLSDLLTGKEYRALADEQRLMALETTIKKRFQADGENAAWVDKEFFLRQANAYDPYYCNSVLYLERLQQEGKYVSLEQLVGKAPIADKLVKDGIVAPDMMSVFRPVSMGQLGIVKKSLTGMGQEGSQENKTLVYIVAAKHIKKGELLAGDESLDSIWVGPTKMEKIQRYILQPDDLLVSRIGAADVALVTEADIAGRVLVAADSLHIIRCTPEIMENQSLIMNTRFMYMYLRSKAGKRQLNSLTDGWEINLLTMKKMLTLKFPTDETIIKEVTDKWHQIQAAKQLIDGYIKSADEILKI